MRLRERLDRVEDLVTALKVLVQKIEEGVDFTVENTGEGTVWQFLHGEIKVLPIKVKATP